MWTIKFPDGMPAVTPYTTPLERISNTCRNFKEAEKKTLNVDLRDTSRLQLSLTKFDSVRLFIAKTDKNSSQTRNRNRLTLNQLISPDAKTKVKVVSDVFPSLFTW